MARLTPKQRALLLQVQQHVDEHGTPLRLYQSGRLRPTTWSLIERGLLQPDPAERFSWDCRLTAAGHAALGLR